MDDSIDDILDFYLGPAPQRAEALPAQAPASTVEAAPGSPWPLCLTDAELHQEAHEAAGAANSRQVRFAQEMAADASIIEAARRAGLSTKYASPWKAAKRDVVQRLVALLREEARRRALVTVEGQIRRVQFLGRKAESEDDLGTALAAEREVSRLAGLTDKSTLTVNAAGPTQLLVINTGVPSRDSAPPSEVTLESPGARKALSPSVPVMLRHVMERAGVAGSELEASDDA